MQTLSESQWVKLRSLAEDVCQRENCRLYDIEFAGGSGGPILRVYIDLPTAPESPEAGVSLNDCENVSRALGLQLDVEDLMGELRYNLEVSSPGLERVLKQPWHFAEAKGQKAFVRLSQAMTLAELLAENSDAEGQEALKRKMEGVLQEANEEGFLFEVDQQVLKVPYEKVEKAHLVFEFEKLSAPKKATPKKNAKGKGSKRKPKK